MIIAQISRYDTKERVLGNSWLLKLFMVPIQILFLTYFWRKRPIFDQNDLSKWWITEYGHVAKSKYQNIYCEYHAIIYQLPQTNPNFFQNTLTANSKSFLERKMANFTEKRCTCENCDFEMSFLEKWILKSKWPFLFQVVNFDHVYLSGKFWYSRG